MEAVCLTEWLAASLLAPCSIRSLDPSNTAIFRRAVVICGAEGLVGLPCVLLFLIELGRLAANVHASSGPVVLTALSNERT